MFLLYVNITVIYNPEYSQNSCTVSTVSKVDKSFVSNSSSLTSNMGDVLSSEMDLELIDYNKRKHYLTLILVNWFRNECKIAQIKISEDITGLIIKYTTRNQYNDFLAFMITKWNLDKNQTINGFKWNYERGGSAHLQWSMSIQLTAEIKEYEYKFKNDYPDHERASGGIEDYERHKGTFNITFDKSMEDKPIGIECNGKGVKCHNCYSGGSFLTAKDYNRPWEGKFYFDLRKVDKIKPDIL